MADDRPLSLVHQEQERFEEVSIPKVQVPSSSGDSDHSTRVAGPQGTGEVRGH